MKKLSFAIVMVGLILLLLNSCLASDSTMVRKGKWGVSLSASGLSNLGIGLYQGGIGVKHWFSSGFALKTTLGFGVSSRESETAAGYTNEKLNQASISLKVGTEFHFVADSKFSPYIYTGVDLTTTGSTLYYPYLLPGPQPGDRRTQHNSSNSIGADVALGLEYFLNKRFSLTGEYQVDLTYKISKKEWTYFPGDPTRQTNGLSDWSTEFGASTSSLILTVYF